MGSSCNTEQDTDEQAETKQTAWQRSLQDKTLPCCQLIWGLWSLSQGCPRTTGARGESISIKWISSWWLPEVVRLTVPVEWVTEGNAWPPRALTEMGWMSGITGTISWWASVISRKFPSAPESSRAKQLWWEVAHCSLTGRRVADKEDFSKAIPPVSNLETTDGLCLLLGIEQQCDPQLRSINTNPESFVDPSPPGKAEFCQPAWVPDRKRGWP